MSTVNLEWTSLLSRVLAHGSTRETRGTVSLEVLGQKSSVPMSRPVLTAQTRKLGYKFQAAEAAWILSGDDRVETIRPYSRQIAEFSDDGEKFFGAYGPKFRSQLEYVAAKLDADPNTRQAVVNVWRENPPATKDYPCTLSLQFITTAGGELDCVASMRSSDLWLGWPYDVFNFSCMAAAVSLTTKLRPRLGTLHLTAGSQHVYGRDMDRVKQALQDPFGSTSSPLLDVSEYYSADDLAGWLWEIANMEGGSLNLNHVPAVASAVQPTEE